MGSQKLVGLSVTLALITLGGIYYYKNRAHTETLQVVTWSNYLPDESLEKFTRKTGIRVEVSYISSNEELLAKIKAGATGFDVIQPSDYMVRQMVSLDILLPLDHARLSHIEHLAPEYRNLPYDPGLKYSVPFNWGTTGIAVNMEKVAVSEPVGWGLLFDSPDPSHTALLDDMREVFAAALRYQGHSINEAATDKLQSAQELIAKTRNAILMFTSEPRALLQNGELNIAHIYSSDGLQAAADNPKFRFFIPKEGGVLWTDNLAIPKTSQHMEQAHRFIDFFLDPDNAIGVVKDKWLATPNRAVLARLPPDQALNRSLYPPPNVLESLQFIADIGGALIELSRLWTELKSS